MWPELHPPAGHTVIAIVGAESTGKTTLAQALAEQLQRRSGLPCTWVPEVLRAWCDAHGRTPRIDEQATIAAEQARQVEEALTRHPLVVTDTSPLMTAVYHHQVFGSDTLDAPALRWQRAVPLTLLTALDLPWQADGYQRQGPAVQAQVDARLRRLLNDAGLPYSVVSGSGPARLQCALDALTHGLQWRLRPEAGLFQQLQERQSGMPRWRWCENCDDPSCEHALRHPARQA